jgi:hypothetical protein
MEQEKIIKNVFDNMIKEYQSSLKSYYPAHRTNGFTERNLTFNFCSQFKEYRKSTSKDPKIAIWQEVPINNKQHFDSLIIDFDQKSVFIIEAKRLYNINYYEKLKEDLNRIKFYYPEIPEFQTLISSFSIYALLLTDLWTSKSDKKGKKKLDLKKQVENEWKKPFIQIFETENEFYHITYFMEKVL